MGIDASWNCPDQLPLIRNRKTLLEMTLGGRMIGGSRHCIDIQDTKAIGEIVGGVRRLHIEGAQLTRRRRFEAGALDGDGTQRTHDLPAGLTFVSATGSNATYGLPGGC
jgi:hypothetical protein